MTLLRQVPLTNLIKYLEKLTQMVDIGNSVNVVYSDFVKVFYKVPTERLLVKLEAHGVGGRVEIGIGPDTIPGLHK